MNLLRRARGDETIPRQHETIFLDWRRRPETGGVYHRNMVLQRGLIMLALIDILYREYCLSRLQEMRKLEVSQ